MADLSTIVSGINAVTNWFFGLFSGFITMIAENDLLLWSVVFAILSGCVFLVIKVIRKFGLRGKR